MSQESAGTFRHSHPVGSLVGLTGVGALVLGVVLDSTSDDNGAVVAAARALEPELSTLSLRRSNARRRNRTATYGNRQATARRQATKTATRR